MTDDLRQKIPEREEDPAARRTGLDRRSGEDRRKVHDISYFENGGVERRKSDGDRRKLPERRKGWIRVNQWSSVLVRAASGEQAPEALVLPAG